MLYRIAILIFLTGLLAGCTSMYIDQEEEVEPTGQLLIWHPFLGDQQELFEVILADYSRLRNVTIVTQDIEMGDMLDLYREDVMMGLGPDIIILSQPFVGPLIRSGTVKPLDNFDINLNDFTLASQKQIFWQNRLYGIPLSMSTTVNCYNKDLIDTPATTIEALQEQVEDGHKMVFHATFAGMFWGLAYHEGILLNTEGKISLENGGYTEWMETLQEMRANPNAVMQPNLEILTETFAEGEISYYPCYSFDIPRLRGRLGKDKLGVTTLPTYQGKPAGPLIGVNTLFVNHLSSAANTEQAIQLARYLTNKQQQTRLAVVSETLIPVNRRVEIEEQFSPISAALIEQSRSAVSFPIKYQPQSALAINDYGEYYFNLVLEGEIDPIDAAIAIREETHAELGIE